MQILSARWTTCSGAYTLNGVPNLEKMEEAMRVSASMFKVPESPEGEVKIAAPCGMWDPAGPVVPIHFLDEDGNTWIGCGTRALANTPNASIVEADFRRRAQELYGDDWHTTKKKKLNWLRKTARREIAAKTPFRLSESGALFICLQSGAVVAVGHAGQLVAKDLVGRCSELTRVSFPFVDTARVAELLGYLRSQDESRLPWPTGTATLTRKRGDVRDSCSVKGLSWAKDSHEAADLLSQGFKPTKIELQWGDQRWGAVDLTGQLISVRWQGKVEGSDPSSIVETRLARFIKMNAAVQRILASYALEGTPLPLDE